MISMAEQGRGAVSVVYAAGHRFDRDGSYLHRTGTAAHDWMRLSLVRVEFSPRELLGGQVWVADVPLPAGEFDQIRVHAGGWSTLSIALGLIEGRWSILSLEVGFHLSSTASLLRLMLRRAQTEGPY